jgi:hypothetical protein
MIQRPKTNPRNQCFLASKEVQDTEVIKQGVATITVKHYAALLNKIMYQMVFKC